VAAARLEKAVEPRFHPDSYGYRPGRSALDAARVCGERCWEYNWVIDLDIRKFFDSVRWDLTVKAVEAHTDHETRWVVLYVKRWLAAPLQLPDGTLQKRDRGTPQGSAFSPVLANLFMHYAFETWLAREFPLVRFERYADDAVIHCVSEHQARKVLAGPERASPGRQGPGDRHYRSLPGRQPGLPAGPGAAAGAPPAACWLEAAPPELHSWWSFSHWVTGGSADSSDLRPVHAVLVAGVG
jgi:Reverse transcriptase (RNA-dependent DNA polymerase)